MAERLEPLEHQPSEGWADQAFCLYLELLTNSESQAFRDHVGSCCEECAALVEASAEFAEAIALSVERVPPPAYVRDRLLKRLQAETTQPPRGFDVLRSRTAVWNPTGIPGVTSRDLASEKGFKTFLLKFEPGAVFPPHPHKGVEHCYVISGDIRSGGLELGPDDFQRAERRTIHRELYSENGCILLLTTTDPKELASS